MKSKSFPAQPKHEVKHDAHSLSWGDAVILPFPVQSCSVSKQVQEITITHVLWRLLETSKLTLHLNNNSPSGLYC